ncbi:MAG: hypothetical protein ABJF23_09815 [Bryobacteraceae bacterium]
MENELGLALLYGGFAFGWQLVLIGVMKHFDLFGMRQASRHLRGQQSFRVFRHPLHVGWLFACWCAPIMTFSHLFLASVTTAYSVFGM